MTRKQNHDKTKRPNTFSIRLLKPKSNGTSYSTTYSKQLTGNMSFASCWHDFRLYVTLRENEVADEGEEEGAAGPSEDR